MTRILIERIMTRTSNFKKYGHIYFLYWEHSGIKRTLIEILHNCGNMGCIDIYFLLYKWHWLWPVSLTAAPYVETYPYSLKIGRVWGMDDPPSCLSVYFAKNYSQIFIVVRKPRYKADQCPIWRYKNWRLSIRPFNCMTNVRTIKKVTLTLHQGDFSKVVAIVLI